MQSLIRERGSTLEDQKIATADQVQSRERRITRHVLTREEAEIANVLRNSVLAILTDEQAPEAFRRPFVEGIDGIHAGTRLLQRVTEVFENRDGEE